MLITTYHSDTTIERKSPRLVPKPTKKSANAYRSSISSPKGIGKSIGIFHD